MKSNTVIDSHLKAEPVEHQKPLSPEQIQSNGHQPLVENFPVIEETQPPKKNNRRWAFLLVGAIALITGGVFGSRWWQYQSTHATTDNAQIEGHISPLAPKIAATVQQVLVKDGDYVKAGQPLVILEDQDLLLKIQQEQANLNAAQAKLQSAKDQVSLTANTNISQVEQAQSNFKAQQADVAAQQTNVQQAQSEAVAAQALVQQAQLGVNAAQAQLQQDQANIATQRSQIQEAELGVNAARAKVTQAEAEVTRTQQDVQRYQTLYSQNVIPAQRLETAQAAFTEAEASLTVAQQGVGQAQATVNNAQSKLQQAQAQVANSQAQLAQAQAAVKTAQARLQQANAQVSQAQAQVEKSLAQANASQAQVAETQASGQEVVVQQDQTQLALAQMKQAEASLALARQQLTYTTITAPVSGYVGQLTAEVGKKIQPGQPLLALVPLKTDDIYIEANFKETELKDLRVGEPADVRVDAYPGEVFRATVTGISPATGAQFALLPPDNATGNFNKVVQWVPVRLAFVPNADPEHKLRAGLSVTVSVETAGGR
ncbi:putative multidrug resistance protein EmrK [Planktothrix tepida]|uniref:Secretion protein HlyD family protein n=1 Tax=Planktothrix tepida PCC 9214 TaxID=671072 RepID=A0A1J1LT33_9CYAN|nr:HlyD family secretion protein [Planktothrix tepida]CAD5965112.1 putative multidrug resistance protein EmrK [Planktothrix tepida]CUR34988.1 Secretion protein HlyD family protein [Planktothrix tepida PCC 9214]